jgi:hypothetical protein
MRPAVAACVLAVAVAGACHSSPPRRWTWEEMDDSPAVRALLEAAAKAEPDGYDDCGGGLESFAIIVIDSVTGEPLAEGAKLIWRAGRRVDSTYALPSRTGEPAAVLQGPFGRPGTYDVVIRRLGYHDWSYNGIRVEQGPMHCSIPQDPYHLRTVLRARLQRLGRPMPRPLK